MNFISLYIDIKLTSVKKPLPVFSIISFSSEASAVALKSGVSTNIAYHEGVATVIDSEKGAMFEASLGTQKFKFDGEM